MDASRIIASFTNSEGSVVFASINECCEYFNETFKLRIQTEQIRRKIASGEMKTFQFQGKIHEVFFDELAE